MLLSTGAPRLETSGCVTSTRRSVEPRLITQLEPWNNLSATCREVIRTYGKLTFKFEYLSVYPPYIGPPRRH